MPLDKYGMYEHTDDEIDRIAQAIGQIQKQRGAAAGWAALPDGWKPYVKRLMRIRNVGFVGAVEILLRLALKAEGQWTT